MCICVYVCLHVCGCVYTLVVTSGARSHKSTRLSHLKILANFLKSQFCTKNEISSILIEYSTFGNFELYMAQPFEDHWPNCSTFGSILI